MLEMSYRTHWARVATSESKLPLTMWVKEASTIFVGWILPQKGEDKYHPCVIVWVHKSPYLCTQKYDSII